MRTKTKKAIKAEQTKALVPETIIPEQQFTAPATGLALALANKPVDELKEVTVVRDRATNEWIVEYDNGKRVRVKNVLLRKCELKVNEYGEKEYVGCGSYEHKATGYACGLLVSTDAPPPIPEDATEIKFNRDEGTFNVDAADAVILSGGKGHAVNLKKGT